MILLHIGRLGYHLVARAVICACLVPFFTSVFLFLLLCFFNLVLFFNMYYFIIIADNYRKKQKLSEHIAILLDCQGSWLLLAQKRQCLLLFILMSDLIEFDFTAEIIVRHISIFARRFSYIDYKVI